MSQQIIDTTTPQPNGKQGEPIRTAFEKTNANFTELYGRVDFVGATAPLVTIPYMTWRDISVVPAMTRRRNADNTAWVEIGPALTPFGTAAYANEQALATEHYGPEPSISWPGMVWADPAMGFRKQRNDANSAWVPIWPLFTEMAVKTGVATQRFKAAPSAAADEATVQSQVFGVAQGIVGFTIGAGRSLDTVYMNSTGKPIVVYVYGASSGTANMGLLGYVGDLPATSAFRTGTGSLAISFLVPTGATYKVSSSLTTLSFWYEYR